MSRNLQVFQELSQSLQSPEGLKFLNDPNRKVIWLNTKARKLGGGAINNFYTYSDFDFTEIMTRLNNISKREERLKVQGYNLEGLKSFNKSVWLDASRQSNLIEGVMDDFDIDLFDFRSKIRGDFAIDPKSRQEGFDIYSYFQDMMTKSQEIATRNDSVIISGNRQKHSLNIETARHFMALKYMYKCAKFNRFKNQSPEDMINIILNSAAIMSGSDIVRFRNEQARVTAYDDEDEPTWIPESPERIDPMLTNLIEFLSSKGEGSKLPTIIATALFHAEYIRIHPFVDGNGRTGRLFSNYLLIKDEFPTISFSYQKKKRYFEVNNTAINNHDLNPLIKFILQEINNSLDNIEECLDRIELNPECAPKNANV